MTMPEYIEEAALPFEGFLDGHQHRMLRYIDGLLAASTPAFPAWNMERIRQNRKNNWNYIDGCMIKAILSLYEIKKEEKYLHFAENFLSYLIGEDGSIAGYDLGEYNLDNICPGKNLFSMYLYTGKKKYRKAMEPLISQLYTSPRTQEGSFWHKKIYPFQVWLDGLFMAQPFYMEYETRYNEQRGCIDSFRQFEIVRKRMRDEKTGLYFHGYDESRSMYWADKETGCSPNIWMRAVGWMLLSLVDTLEVMDEALYYERRFLQEMLKDLCENLIAFQDPTGLFWQLPVFSKEAGNYLETSGTALFSYGLLKAVRLGFLPGRFAERGKAAYRGIAERYLKTHPDGNVSLGGICLVAGLGGKEGRDGSRRYYYSEPVVDNEAKGVAPFLLAFTELLRG